MLASLVYFSFGDGIMGNEWGNEETERAVKGTLKNLEQFGSTRKGSRLAAGSASLCLTDGWLCFSAPDTRKLVIIIN